VSASSRGQSSVQLSSRPSPYPSTTKARSAPRAAEDDGIRRPCVIVQETINSCRPTLSGTDVNLILLRHGETEWNLTGRMQGLSDTQLTGAGLDQAHEAVAKMPVFSQIWTSPLQRARLTAQIIADAQGARCTVDARLIERSWGEWEGMLPAEVDRQWPGWRAEGRKPPGYEQDSSVFMRFQAWLADVPVDGRSEPVAAVTHGGFMSAVVRVLGGADTGYKNLEGVWLADDCGRLRIVRHEEFIPNARRLTR
jgi:broad specificity phosphatase PhoE